MPTTPRSVLMTADTVGGVFTYAAGLARSLVERGVTVHLATMGRAPSDAQRAEIAAIGGVVLHESTWKLEWMDSPWDDVARAGEWLLELEHRLRPDLVHLNGYAHGALGFSAPVVVVGHSCVVSWWHAVHGGDPPSSFERYREEVRRGLSAADVIVAPTRAMLDALARHHGPFDGVVVPNACPIEPSGRAAKEPFVFAAGRLWDPAKGIATLAEAAPELPWPVVVAGDAHRPDGGEFRGRNVKELGILPHADVLGWAARAAIYALPARYEPFGLSVLEAARAGCALVLGDVASLREVWGDAALYVPPGDRAALASAIRSLASDASRRGALAEAARARSLRYSPERTVAGYLAVYRRALESRRPPLSATV